MLPDPFLTKGLIIAIALAMYGIALTRRRLSRLLIVLCFAFLTLGAPLGYDTLMYSIMISAGGLNNYGPLWSALGAVAGWTDAWWVVHLVAYVAIVWSFVALSRRSSWPSLLLATLTTMPGLGFDFLSVMRQGLCTAFIIFYYLALRDSRYLRALVLAVLAFLAHPAGLFGVVVLVLVRFRSEPLRILMAVTATWAVVFAVSVGAPAFFESQLNNAAFLLARYLLSEDTIENETGGKLFLVWIVILAIPVLLAAIAKRIRWFSSKMFGVVMFLAAYGLLLTVSGSSVRLIWLFLPMLMAGVVSTLTSRPRHPVLLGTRIAFATACFAASAFVLSVAPEYFWAGDYPHEIHFVQ